MKAEIDQQQLLQLHPESLTERTALFAWWESLPADLRAQLKGRVLPFYENQDGRMTAAEVIELAATHRKRAAESWESGQGVPSDQKPYILNVPLGLQGADHTGRS
jgi:hypothetical protein